MNGTLEKLAKELENIGDGFTVTITETKKINGNKTGLKLRAEHSNLAPVIYPDGVVAEVEGGNISLAEAAEKLLQTYEYARIDAPIEDMTSKQYILDNVCRSLINREKNKELLENVAHKDFLDLSVIFKCRIPGMIDGGVASYNISQAIMLLADITMEELEEAAIKNEKYIIQSLGNTLQNLGMDVEEIPNDNIMIVITDEDCMWGSAAMLNMAYMQRVYKLVGGDFYILPSSLHEVIAVPCSLLPAEAARDLVMGVNSDVLDAADYLSDSIYKYCAKQDAVIKIA